MEWPQITYLAITLLGIGICLERHGKPKQGNYNVIVELAASSIAWFLLYKGGFFG